MSQPRPENGYLKIGVSNDPAWVNVRHKCTYEEMAEFALRFVHEGGEGMPFIVVERDPHVGTWFLVPATVPLDPKQVGFVEG